MSPVHHLRAAERRERSPSSPVMPNVGRTMSPTQQSSPPRPPSPLSRTMCVRSYSCLLLTPRSSLQPAHKDLLFLVLRHQASRALCRLILAPLRRQVNNSGRRTFLRCRAVRSLLVSALVARPLLVSLASTAPAAAGGRVAAA
jgi:hypothetical protein